jgi:hypothetical protein
VVPRLCVRPDIYHLAQRGMTLLGIRALLGDLREAKDEWRKMFGTTEPPGDFCISRIPDDGVVTWPFADDFPECQMRELYTAAEKKARDASANPWETTIPPGGPSPGICSPESSSCTKAPTCSAHPPGCDACGPTP